MTGIHSEAEQLAHLITQQTTYLESIIMATKAELDASLTRLQTAVSGKVDALSAHLAGMQQTLDSFVAADTTEDAAFAQEIADLKAQLASQLDGAVAAVNALTDAVSGTPA